jgi:putative membrane protein
MKRLIVLVSVVAALTPAVAGASAPAQDEQWLQSSISGDRFEVRGGQIALQRATSPQVKALGRRLIRDHSKSLAEAIALANAHLRLSKAAAAAVAK